jgi:hypothetical protein
MSNVLTKNAPFWRGLVAKLSAKRAKQVADFEDLVTRLSNGEELGETAVESALSKAGKSVYDLEAAVAARVERLDMVNEIERLRATVLDGESAAHDDEAAIQSHNAKVEAMLRELNRARAGFQPRRHAGDAARTQIETLETKLRNTAPAHLGEQQLAIREELAEAVAALNSHDSYLDRNRTVWRNAVERNEPLGDMSPDACADALKEQERVRETLAARVAELQAEMADLEAAKVQP